MNHPWFDDAIFYHIYTFSLARAPFYNDYTEEGHGLAEIIKWIPHIREIGCNAVLLSPVLQSRSHGYDVTDYFRVDSRIGSNAEFRSLTDAFHEAGIRVVLDSVLNHCGRDFFAFRELQNGDRKYADWFSGVDFSRESPLGDPFTYDTWSGYFELVKFNLKNDETSAYLLDAVRFWIDEFAVDGLRLDAANVMDFGFMRKLRQVTEGKKEDFWLMGEVVSGDYAAWVAPDLLHSVTNYKLYKALYSSHNNQNLFELAHSVQESVPRHGLPLYAFLDNHDQPRIASNVADVAYLKTLYTLLYTLPGLPSLYYGSEWGISGVKIDGSDQPLRPWIDVTDPPADPVGLAACISLLAKIRRAHGALRDGGYRQVWLAYRRPFVFERFDEKERIFIAVHIADHEDAVAMDVVTDDLTDGGSSGLSGRSGSSGLSRLYDALSGETFTGGVIPMGPHSARILIPISNSETIRE